MSIDFLESKEWRMNNLYRVVNKQGDSVAFRLNSVQQDVLNNLHSRNLILKARQLGMSTFAVLYLLDEAIFNDNTSAGIVSYSLEHAQHIFKRIIGHALDSLTPIAKQLCGIIQRSAREITFANGSYLRVDTTLRGGAYQLVLVSEFGKTCARNPLKAEEVVTGTLQSVPSNGKIIIESTGEGSDGFFYEMCTNAAQRGNDNLSPLDYRLFFFSWSSERSYSINDRVSYSVELTDYFDKIEKAVGIKINQQQRYWYALQAGVLGDKVRQEYPSCISSDVPVLCDQGVLKIREVLVDNGFIKNHFYQGIKQVYKLTTNLGYTLKATADHKIKTVEGFKNLSELKNGESVLLSHGTFPKKYQNLKLSSFPLCNNTLKVTNDLGRFLGYFVGDGSFYGDSLSVACDSQDQDVVQDIIFLIKELFGLDAYTRQVGSKKGCTEIRISKKDLKPLFWDLGIVRSINGHVKRKVLVPNFIKVSPKSVVSSFLRSYFESDGFVGRVGFPVRCFSTCETFLRDIQLLLLQFGITSRKIKVKKIAGNGSSYIGHELCLRKEESKAFHEHIGFTSKRKNDRLELISTEKHKYTANQISMELCDSISSIEKLGFEEVYDITTETGEFSAGGITVHNCISEAFLSSSDAYYYQAQIEKAYQENRMLSISPYDAIAPVYVAMDIGVTDLTVMIFFQVIHGEIRVIDYYSDNNKGIEFYAQFLLKEKKYLYHTLFLPHDARKKDGLIVENTYEREFKRLLQHTETKVLVLKQTDINIGIGNAQIKFDRCVFAISKVKSMIDMLSKYRKKWSEQYGKYLDTPSHDISSHASDAFRYAMQAVTHIETVGGQSGALDKHKRAVESRRKMI